MWSKSHGIINIGQCGYATIFETFWHQCGPWTLTFFRYFDSAEDLRAAVEELLPKKGKYQYKFDSVCGSNINNGSNSEIDINSDDYETKDDDGFESDIDTKCELSYDRIQQMLCSMKISEGNLSMTELVYLNLQYRKGWVKILTSQLWMTQRIFLKEVKVNQWRSSRKLHDVTTGRKMFCQNIGL